LTVLGGSIPVECYAVLELLLDNSDGWKELYYITHSSTMLAFSEAFVANSSILRKPQPSRWQRALKARDGVSTKPSVTIYRSTKLRLPGSVLYPETRKIFEQTIDKDQNPEEYGLAW
jgi:hypothetical protein